MSAPAHHMRRADAAQGATFLDDLWATEVVPSLPGELCLKAHALGAFQRLRGIASPTDLLRALLA